MNKETILLNTETFLHSQKIYLITLDKVEEFSYRINEGVGDMARLTGINYIWDAPEERVVEEQINVINNAVLNGADLIMLAALDPIRVSSAVREAKASGVGIIYVDAPADEEAIVTLSTDNYSAGRLAGQLMINELQEVGIFEGSIGVVGVSPEIVTTMNRQYGFYDIIVQDGRYRLLETQYAQGNPIIAQSIVETYINENSDLVGVFGTNEGATIGMGYALMASNRPIVGIGFDVTDIIRDMLDAAVIKAVLMQNPYTMGYLGMALAIAALTGKETGPSFINTGVSIVTRYMRRIAV